MPAFPLRPDLPMTSEPPTQPALEATDADVMPNVRVPGYDLRRIVGRGGMGVVFKAVQHGVDRVVALKMILSADYASPADLARFREEARAIGRIAHPNIVQIYEVGEVEGRPFLALEYCDGGTLCGQLHGAPWEPRRAAALVSILARAIQAAHQAGIIHRDLKPANILLKQIPPAAAGPLSVDDIRIGSDLVGWNYTPKISDFGLSKQIGTDRHLTRTGVVMGTASYMAPEQATGDYRNQGPATDVYALGAILYELLTGRPPFRAAHDVETLLQVVHSDPVSPQQLQPKLSRDVATITMKCLEKSARRRYAAAADLADDLDRYLAGRPVQARPVGRWEQVWRWSKRNPPAAILALTTAAGLGLALAGLIFGVARLSYANALDRAALKRIERSQLRTLEAVNEVLSEAVATLLDQQPELQDEQKRFLQRAAEILGHAESGLYASPKLQANAGRAQLKLSEILFRLDQSDDALRAAESARESFSALARDHPTVPEYRAGLADAHIVQGRLWLSIHQTVPGEEAVGRGLALWEDLARSHPGGVHSLGLAKALQDWAEWLYRSGRPGEAVRPAERAVEIYSRHPDQRAKRLRALLTQCKVYFGKSEYDKLKQSSQEAVDLGEELARDDNRAEARENLAEAHKYKGFALRGPHSAFNNVPASIYQLIIDHLDQAAKIRLELTRQYPGVASYRAEYARAKNNLGRLHLESKKHDEAADAHEQAKVVLERLVEEYPARSEYVELLANTHLQRGFIAIDQEEWDQAIDHFSAAIKRIEPLVRGDRPLMLARQTWTDSHNARAGVYEKLQQFDNALADRDTVLAHASGDDIKKYALYRGITLLKAAGWPNTPDGIPVEDLEAEQMNQMLWEVAESSQ